MVNRPNIVVVFYNEAGNQAAENYYAISRLVHWAAFKSTHTNVDLTGWRIVFETKHNRVSVQCPCEIDAEHITDFINHFNKGIVGFVQACQSWPFYIGLKTRRRIYIGPFISKEIARQYTSSWDFPLSNNESFTPVLDGIQSNGIFSGEDIPESSYILGPKEDILELLKDIQDATLYYTAI